MDAITFAKECVQAYTKESCPGTVVLRASLTALEDQHLPPLPTTALRGVLARTLRREVCPYREWPPCEGCILRRRCAYPALIEPPAQKVACVGVTDKAPAPFVMAPELPYRGDAERFIALAGGETLRVRLTLIGAVSADRPLVEAALARAAAQGIGVRPGEEAPHGERPALRLESVEEVSTPPEAEVPPPEAELHFVTPVRISDGGRIVDRIDTEALCRTLCRRVDTLSRLYGRRGIGTLTVLLAGGRSVPFTDEWMFDFLKSEGAVDKLQVEDGGMRRVEVRRYSSRQGRRMVWPGRIGTLRLSGDPLAPLWPLLRFCERVQVGKGTTFGFGRYVLAPA